jgi:hypothetical protein
MHRSLLAALAVLGLAPSLAAAQAPLEPSPTGLSLTASLGGGGEVGLDHGKAGIFEVEGTAGYELGPSGFRPEVGLAFGLDPDTHFAVRPGVRWTIPAVPVQVRAALDASNSREGGLHWRWLLVGLAAEMRLTGLLGLYAEVDSGAPLSSDHGVPLLVRGGISLRL